MTFTDIKVRTFIGKEFKEFIPCMARLKVENYEQYPYLYKANLEEEKNILRSLADKNDSVAVIVFEGTTIVGVSTGSRFIYEKKELLKPFLEKHIDPSKFFILDGSFLLKPYRGRGISHHFFDLRENHAKSLEGIEYTCFYSFHRNENCPFPPPEDYLAQDNFWRKRGYVYHPEMSYSRQWKDIGAQEEEYKDFSCWIKEI